MSFDYWAKIVQPKTFAKPYEARQLWPVAINGIALDRRSPLSRDILTFHAKGPGRDDKIEREAPKGRRPLNVGTRGPLAKIRAAELFSQLPEDEQARRDEYIFESIENWVFGDQYSISQLPAGAVQLTFQWTTETPFFSHADNKFDVFDNPLARDLFSGRPYQKVSGAKGMLRHWMKFQEQPDTETIFGLSGDDDGGHSALAVCGDVYFDQSSADLISPHNRISGGAVQPIFFEVVPEDAKAEWQILVWPRHGQRNNLAADICTIAVYVERLLTEAGMSAKRTIGFGEGRIDSLTVRLGVCAGAAFNTPGEPIIPFETQPPQPIAKPDRYYEFVDENSGRLRDANVKAAFARYKERKLKNLGKALRRHKEPGIDAEESLITKAWQDARDYFELEQSGDLESAKQRYASQLEDWNQCKRRQESAPENVRWRLESVNQLRESLQNPNGPTDAIA